MTIQSCFYDGSDLIVPGNLLATLENCDGYYECPMDEHGRPIGPLVGYAGQYVDDKGISKHYVGLVYCNFSMADMWPAVLTEFAEKIAWRFEAEEREYPTLIIGAPWAGIKLSQEVARLLGCRHIFAEKKFVGQPGAFKGDVREVSQIILGRYEGMITPGDRVFIGEELVNNLSTTGDLCRLVHDSGAEAIGILCAINRSFPFVSKFLFHGKEIPITSAIEQSMKQYKQDDPLVAELVQQGEVVWKPKYEWPRLRAAMNI